MNFLFGVVVGVLVRHFWKELRELSDKAVEKVTKWDG